MPTNDYDVFRRSVKELLSNNNQYVVPSYQRNYAWTIDNAVQLLNDLIEAADEAESPTTNLLGAIVIKEEPNSPESEIVDGQQRLATLSLIFCAIRTYIYKFNDLKLTGIQPTKDKAIKTLDNFLKVKNNTRITLGGLDQELFRDIITNNDSDYKTFCKNMRDQYQLGKKRISESHALMIKNYLMLCERIDGWAQKFHFDQLKESKNIEGFNAAMIELTEHVDNMTERNHFAHIRVHETYVAYKIFSTFNSLGQQLLQADLIKSELLKLTKKNNTEYKFVERTWQKIFDERLEDPDIFLYESLSSRHPTGKVKKISISMSNLYRIIQSEYKSSESVRSFVVDLNIDSKHLKQMDHPEDIDDAQKFNKIKSDFHGIQLINARYIRVPILAAYREWGHSRLDDIMELVDCLLIFFFKFKFINDGTAETVRTIANNVTKRIMDKENIATIIYHILVDEDVRGMPKRRIDEERFVENFSQKMFKLTANTAKYILSSLEIYIRKEECKESDYPNYNFELEHILPKNHEKYWNEAEFLGTEFTDPIIKYKNRLGNLTLLSSKWNKNVGAKDFQTKKQKGYDGSDFLINKKYLKNYDVWTASNLERRENELCRLAQKVWSLDKYEKYLTGLKHGKSKA